MEKSFLFKAQFSPYYNNAVVGGISSGCFFLTSCLALLS